MGIGPSAHERLERELTSIPGFPEERRISGLNNLGSTCFVNSVVQALYSLDDFRDALLRYHESHEQNPEEIETGEGEAGGEEEEEKEEDGGGEGEEEDPTASVALMNEMCELFTAMKSHQKRVSTVQTKPFVTALRKANPMYRRGDEHQDAHELLNFLLNTAADEMEEAAPRPEQPASLSSSPALMPPSPASSSSSSSPTRRPKRKRAFKAPDTTRLGSTLVHSTFQGLIASETRCLGCDTVTTRDETFLDIGVDVAAAAAASASSASASPSSLPSRDGSTLAWLLEKGGEDEALRGSDKFFCDTCACLQEAIRRTRLKTLPRVLVIQLKRFKFVEQTGVHRKLPHRVVFPLTLVAEGRPFSLSSAVVHVGRGPNQGHYVTVAKCCGVWLLYDDDEVTVVEPTWFRHVYGRAPTNEPNAPSCCAYLLFYQRDDGDVVASSAASASSSSRPPEPASVAATSEVVVVDTSEPMQV